MKIAFFGYDFFYDCLAAIPEAGHEVMFVATYDKCDNLRYNFNNRTVQFARDREIPVRSGRVPVSDLVHLRNSGCGLLVSAAYPYRIPIEEVSGLAAVNVHPSLLPEGRGPWPLPHLILKDKTVSGVTIHRIEKQMDSGDVLLRESFSLGAQENLESLSMKSQMLAAAMFRRFLRDPDVVIRQAMPQEAFGTPEYWPHPTLADRTLDWSRPVRQLDRIARAFGKFNSCATFDDREWIVDDVTVWEDTHSLSPGTVVHRSSCEVVVAASDGYVCLRHFEADPESMVEGE